MSVHRAIVLCFAMCVTAPCGSRAGERMDALARLVSAPLRTHDEQLAAQCRELDALPPAPSDQGTECVGWHSRLQPLNRSGQKSLTIDLGSVMPFDSVALVPANVPFGALAGPGYGFPVRFRVEALDETEHALPITLADFTSADFSPPGNLPVVLPTPGAQGRFVRVTATQLFSRGDYFLFALGEAMVLRGSRNLAAGAAVRVSDNYANAPAWQPENATDSQSVLGPPIHLEPTNGHGYHSQVAREEATTKWVQLDLGSAHWLDEVRLYAARPNDFPPRRGFGFPLRFRVEASDQADFAQPTTLASWVDHDFPNPGENPVVIPAREVSARFVRVTATRLWSRNNDFVFALGEMEVFSGERNIARDAVFSASDNLETGRWSAAQLTDGFTSQGRLVDLPEWLRGLSKRREVEHEIARLEALRGPLVAGAWRRLGWLAGGGVAFIAIASGWWLVRRRRLHQRELARLRQRIASDLHDEIGSNLGSIALLARLAADQRSTDSHADLAEIHRIAQETADSMRDIVWLIQPGPRAAADLLARMREVAAQLLAEIEWKFEAEEVGGPFSLDFERQVFLLYKEALNNIRKHARARRVTIRVAQQGGEFVLAIIDDGTGFDPAHTTSGHGLASMQHRAELLGARLAWQSEPANGTQIELRARLA